MLVIISDLHLGDGTTAESIPTSAFNLFAKRLRQDARFASIRDGKYHPIEELDVILLGDILDPIHSTRWFYPIGDQTFTRMTKPEDAEYIRPWSDPNDEKYAQKLSEVTHAILEENKESMEVMRRLANGEFIEFDSSDDSGIRDFNSQKKISLKVRFHYMVGNHDWYYHLKGEAFDQIRREIIETMGLSNPSSPFPHDLRKLDPKLPWDADDSPDIERLFRVYKVFGRHGDIYDSFNFDREKGRDHPTLGDAFAMEVLNKYPEELKRIPGVDVKVLKLLSQLTNVRPALATPLWISGQIRSLAMRDELKDLNQDQLKKVWDKLADEFLELDFVREKDKSFQLDAVDKLEAVIKVSKLLSFESIDTLTLRLQGKNKSGGDRSFAKYALQEPSFLDNSARYIIYGHTHHHETIPLDYDDIGGNQIYFNSGTWHTYFDLARKNPVEKKFIPYKALTYVTFYKDHEHDERNFETWSGAYA